MGAIEGAIQPDLFSEKSLEWLMLIDILVIWSCFAQRTFFLENLLSDLMLPRHCLRGDFSGRMGQKASNFPSPPL